MFDWLAMIRIDFIDLQAMFVVVSAMSVVHVTIMQVVCVIAVSNHGVTAVFTVLMVVVFMYFAFISRHARLRLFFAARN